MGTLHGTYGPVINRTIFLAARTKYLRALFDVTLQQIRRCAEGAEEGVALRALMTIGKEQCEELERIGKEVREIADERSRKERENIAQS